MDKLQGESAATIPICDVRYTVQEVRQRMRVTEQMSGFIEDQSDNENRFGLSLQKTNALSVSTRADWLPVVTASWECVIKTTAAVGKQHVNRSLGVSSTAAKAFPEVIKTSLKKIVGFVTKIQGQLEEMHKAKKAFKKAEDKYKRSFTEVDAAIRARDAAIAAFTAGEALPVASGGAVGANPMNMKALAGLGSGASSGNSGPEAINKLQMKCKDLFREFESCEQLVVTHIERFARLRAEYEGDVAQGQAELLRLERMSRMEAVRQYIERFYMTSDLFVSRCADALAVLSGDTGVPRGEINLDCEVAPFLATLKTLEDDGGLGLGVALAESMGNDAFQPSPNSSDDEGPCITAALEEQVDPSGPATPERATEDRYSAAAAPVVAVEEEEEEDVHDVLDASASQTGAIIEYLDLFRVSAGRALHQLTDIVDGEKAYLRSSYKTFEKHCLVPQLLQSGLSQSARAYFSTIEPQLMAAVGTTGAGAGAATVPTDSPTLQACWLGLVRFYVCLFDAHASTAEALSSKLVPQCESMLRRADTTKKEVLERQRQYRDKLQTCRAVIRKASNRLRKLRRELKERRGAIKVDEGEGGSRESLSRESVGGSIGAGPVSLGAGVVPALPPREPTSPSTVPADPLNTSVDSVDLTSANAPASAHNETAVAVAAASTSTAAPAPTARRKSMLAGFDKFVRGTQKLGAAVGLATAETAEARVVRIQLQIAEMEEEEVVCVRDVDVAQAALAELNTSFMVALTASIEAVKAALRADVDFLRSASVLVDECFTKALDSSKRSSASLQELFKAIDVDVDMTEFVQRVRVMGGGASVNAVASTASGLFGEVGGAAASTPAVAVDDQAAGAVADADTYAALLRSCSQNNDTMLSAMGLKKPAVGITAGSLSGVSAYMSTCTVAEERAVLAPILEFKPFRTELIEFELLNQNQSRLRGSSMASPTSTPASPDSDTPKVRSGSGGEGEGEDASPAPPPSEEGSASGDGTGNASVGSESTANTTTSAVATKPVLAIEGHPTVPAAADDSSGTPRGSPRPATMNRRRSRSFDQQQMQALLTVSDGDGDVEEGSGVVESAAGSVGSTAARARVFSSDAESIPAAAPKSANTGVLPELVKFGLSISDRIIESHACAYYPKRGIMSQGRMYITQHFVAFSSWDGTRILLPLYYIKSLEKANSLFIISNALLIKTCSLAHTRVSKAKKPFEEAPAETAAEGGDAGSEAVPAVGNAGAGAGAEDSSMDEEYNFGSFVDRDQCFSLLLRLQEIEKRLYSVNSEEMTELLVSSGLVFGNQRHMDKEPEEPHVSASGEATGVGDASRTPVARRTSMAMFTSIMKGKKEEAPLAAPAPVAPAAAGAGAEADKPAPAKREAEDPAEDSTAAAKNEALFADACTKYRLKVPAFSSEVIDMTVKEFHATFVEDAATYGLIQHHEICGDNSMVLSPWVDDPCDAAAGSRRTRAMKFMKVCNLPGLKQTRGTKSQTLTMCGRAGSVIYTTTKLDDVPFADVFTVDDCFIIKTVGPNQVSIEATMEVKYVKSTMMKTFIDGSTNKEVVAWCRNYLVALRKNAPAAGAAEGGSAGTVAATPAAPTQSQAQAVAPISNVTAGPLFSDTYSMIIAGLLGLVALLLLFSLIQQYRSHYFIIQRVEELLERATATGADTGGGDIGSCAASK